VIGRINAFNAGSFQMIYPTNNTTAYLIHYVVIGGADITNALVLEFTDKLTPTGNRNDTGFGFDPEFIFILHGPTATAAPATTSSYKHCVGAAKSSSARWAAGVTGQDAQTMAVSFGAVNDLVTNRVINTLTNGATPAVEASADFVAFITDGYTLNWLTVPAAARRYATLALRGGQHAVGAFSKTTGASGSADDITAPGFTLKGVFQATTDRLGADGIGGDSELAIGAFDGTREGHAWGEWSDTALNTEANVKIDTAKVISTNTGPSTMKAEADCSFITNGFRNTWSTNDAVATEVAWWAVGDEPAATVVTLGHAKSVTAASVPGAAFHRQTALFVAPPAPAPAKPWSFLGEQSRTLMRTAEQSYILALLQQQAAATTASSFPSTQAPAAMLSPAESRSAIFVAAVAAPTLAFGTAMAIAAEAGQAMQVVGRSVVFSPPAAPGGVRRRGLGKRR
jgi:hypothetical protein